MASSIPAHERNVAAVKHMYDCFGKKDIPGILSQLDETVQWNNWPKGYEPSAQTANVPYMKELKGRGNAQEFFRFLSEQKVTLFKVLSVVGGGNIVMSRCAINMTTTTGGTADFEEMHYFEFNDSGKATLVRIFLDSHKLILAWGGQKTT